MRLDYGFMASLSLKILQGLPATLGLAMWTLALALPAGLALAIVRIYRPKPFNGAAVLWVSFFRGTPIVLQILIVYSLLPSLLNAFSVRFGLGWQVFGADPFWYAVTVFSLNTSAVFSEVFRSAILTVDRGQLEAALAAGLTTPQAWRRIVLPQAFVVSLPNLANGTINLLKGTSLAFMMTVKDVTAIARIEASYGYTYVEAYLVVFGIYIVLGLAIQAGFAALERKSGEFRRTIAYK